MEPSRDEDEGAMHDVLRQRLLRKIESLPEEQIYQVLDYIEFLESKYARDLQAEASGLQRFAERMEDQLRRRAVSPVTLREAFQLISAADRVLSGVSSAGRQIFSELNEGFEGPEAPPSGAVEGGARIGESDTLGGEEGPAPGSGSEGPPEEGADGEPSGGAGVP